MRQQEKKSFSQKERTSAKFYDFSDEEIEQMNAFIELVEKGLEY